MRDLMRDVSKGGLIVAALAALAACQTASRWPPTANAESITVPYNPYDYDPDDLVRQAQAHCAAYGRNAVYVDETIDPTSVRWRYRHFNCV